MAGPPPNPTTIANLLTTQSSLVQTMVCFLTVVIHQVLSLRRIYPPVSFISTRAYNYPVRQNRHPAVCTWVNDAMALVRDQLEKNTLSNIAICIYECDRNRVLERWVVDLRSFPKVEKRERDMPFAADAALEPIVDASLGRNVNLADLEAQFRAILSRLSVSANKLQPLPSGPEAPELSFTITVEVGEDADRPVGRLGKVERAWVAAEPEAFESDMDVDSVTIAAGRTIPIRRLEVGELRLEVWIAESKAKFELASTVPPERSTGAQVQDKFDEERGYELEPTDLNRPQPPTASDYRR